MLDGDSRVGFYKKRLKDFMERYCEYVQYVQKENDAEIRRYRLNELMKDCPYVTYSKAQNVLDCQEGFAKEDEKPFYIEKNLRSDLIDNIVLAMVVLHYEFGFAEKRISRIFTEWAHCGINEPRKWVEKKGVYIESNTKEDVYDWIEKFAPKKQRVTVKEQLEAKARMDALRAYQQAVREGTA